MSRRSVAAALTTLILEVAACGGTTLRPTATDERPSSPARSVDAGRTTAAPESKHQAAVALVRTAGSPRPAVVAVDTPTGRIAARLPDGPMAADGSAVFAVRPLEGDTEIDALDVWSGAAMTYRTLPGGWAWPTMGADRTPIGLAGDGSSLVLVSTDPPPGRSRFAVLPATLADDPAYVDLAGTFDVDGLSPGGGTLYLVERRGGRDYAIRSADVATSRLDPDPVVDKREGGEAMVGQAVGRVVSSSWLHTLYRAEEPFLHSLDASNRFTWCIELDPGIGSSPELALALTRDGGLGWLVDVAGGAFEPIDVTEGLAGAAKAFQWGLPVTPSGAPIGSTVVFDPSLELHRSLILGTTRGLVRLDPAMRVAETIAPGRVVGLGRSASGVAAAVFEDGTVRTVDR